MRLARQIDLAAVGLLAAVTAGGLMFWQHLPEQMAIHWNAQGADSFVGKNVAVFGILGLGVATVAFVRLLPDRYTNTPGGENVTVLFLGVVFAWVQGAVLTWNLGYRFDMWLAVVPVLVLAAGLVIYQYFGTPLR